jgi:hypothetical protein
MFCIIWKHSQAFKEEWWRQRWVVVVVVVVVVEKKRGWVVGEISP